MSRTVKENKSTFVPRITQLDANEFDQEIRNVLLTQLTEINKYLKPGALNTVKFEINLLLDALIFYYSVVNKNATFGQELLSLKYKELLSKNQLVVYGLLNCVLPYLKNKYEYLFDRAQNINISNSVEKVNIFIKICEFLNSLIFLREGRYPTLIDRLLKLKYCSVNKTNQPVGYNYMTRELLWHGFMELLMYVLPLINYKALKRKIKKPFLTKSPHVKYEKNIIYNIETKCVVCDDFPVLPCQISTYCPHLACYYCIKSNLLADEKFMCPICGETNTAIEKLKFLGGFFGVKMGTVVKDPWVEF